jgi:tetratricopeptide (TPR) repeat protein
VLISEKPDWAAPYLGLGNSLVALKQREGAAEAYAHAVELNPGWFEAQFALGTTLLESGRSKEALPVLLKAEGLRPDDASVLSRAAISMADLRKDQEAIGYFERAERICSSCLDAQARATWQRSRERLSKRH